MCSTGSALAGSELEPVAGEILAELFESEVSDFLVSFADPAGNGEDAEVRFAASAANGQFDLTAHRSRGHRRRGKQVDDAITFGDPLFHLALDPLTKADILDVLPDPDPARQQFLNDPRRALAVLVGV